MSFFCRRCGAVWRMVLLTFIIVIIEHSHCFESRRRFFKLPTRPCWGIRKEHRWSSSASSSSSLNGYLRGRKWHVAADSDDDDMQETIENQLSSDQSNIHDSKRQQDQVAKPNTRRNLIMGSAAAFLSSVLATATSGIVKPPIVADAASSLAVLEESENRRIEVFERNAPSVVFIDTFAEKQDVFSPNVMEVPLGTGSGFVWDKEGHIVTNYHVVRNAKFAQVALITPRKGEKLPMGFLPSKQQQKEQQQQASSTSMENDITNFDVFTIGPYSASRLSSANKVSSADYKRTVFRATVIGCDPGKDIAVLKIDAPNELLYPIQVGKSVGLKVGQLSLAIGNPFGLDHTLTSGVISGLGREVKSPIGRPITNVIQTDAAINPGNSGGVLLNSSGKLIGMNTAIYSPTGASAGIGFAIPVDTVKVIVNTLIRDGKVVRPILGISFLESKQARALGIGRGVLVLDVPPDSPAAKSGLRGTRRTETGLVEIGDIIVKVGDTLIETEANLFQALEDYKPGDFVEVKVLRIEAANDQLTQRDLTLNIQLQSSEILEQPNFLLRQQ